MRHRVLGEVAQERSKQSFVCLCLSLQLNMAESGAGGGQPKAVMRGNVTWRNGPMKHWISLPPWIASYPNFQEL